MSKSGFFQSSGATATAQNTIQGSVDAAAASATAAASSETDAQTAQAASEAARDASQTAQTASETAKTAAETAETNAETAETNAASSATTASTQATNAASSATTASGHASTATTKASEAATSATNAATSAATATTQASTATTKASEASTSATNAATSASTASTHASNASTSASTASTQASNAASSASTASGHASTATTKASEAATSATNAATSASTASTQATNAGNSATAAASSASAASTSASNAASSLSSFNAVYSTGSSDPTSNLDAGDLFYNQSAGVLKVYTGSAWEQGVTAGSGFLALTGGQLTGNLTFSGSQTVDGRDLSADGAKLDGIEASATADQTAAEIRTLVENATDSNVFTDADHTKLNAIEASADVTDTANVVAALTAGTGITIAGDGTIASTASSDLVDDSSPQLGGALDVQTHSIVSTSNRDITLAPNGTGEVTLSNNILATAGTTSIRPAGTEIVTINNTGDVTVKGQGSNRAMMLLKAGSNTANSQIRFGDQAADSAGRIYYDHSHNFMRFDTNESERMRLDSSGNVGIGTTTIDFGLTVEKDNGNGYIASFRKSSSDPFLTAITTGGITCFQGVTSNGAAYSNTAINPLGGKVGIGTASPSEPLHISGTSGAAAVFERTDSASVGIRLLGNGMSASTAPKISAESGPAMAFTVNNGERMRLDSSGDVLIGKTSEALATTGSQFRSSGQALDITRDGGSPLNINRLSSSGELVGFFQDTAQFGQITCFTTNSTDYLQIGSSGSNNAGVVFENQRMYPTIAGSASSGTVDLGTSSVRFKNLWLSSNVNTSGYVYAAGIAGSSDGNTYVNFPGSDVMQFFTGGSERARVTTNRFLVGKTSTGLSNAGHEFSTDGFVYHTRNGNIMWLNCLASSGSAITFQQNSSSVGSVAVNSSGTTYNTTSDIRLKQDIEPLAATDKLMQMNPVSYNWKSDPDGPRSMGFIAQEMGEVMPEAVSMGDDDIMSMDYGRITPILVSALQDAHRKIEQLEQRIAEMETGNE